jgi:hypothetical protein
MVPRKAHKLTSSTLSPSFIFIPSSTSPSPTPRRRPNHTNVKQRKIPIYHWKPSRSSSLTGPAKLSVDLWHSVRAIQTASYSHTPLPAGRLPHLDFGQVTLLIAIRSSTYPSLPLLIVQGSKADFQALMPRLCTRWVGKG